MMATLDTIRKPIEEDLTAFEDFVAQKFSADDELLSEMLKYALSTRGKGIRPLIVMLSAAMNSGGTVGCRAYLAAMLVEMIHVASLIHDDVIDEADTRRGHASVNAKWQSHNAVILGDYILARNMSIGMSSAQFDIVGHVCEAISTLCEGEILQSDRSAKQEMSRRSYLDIIYKKTASLISVSASVGALSVKATSEKIRLMRSFGEAIGMAFQIQDDILDYTRTANTGKPANNDLRENKITLPLLAVLEKASESERAEMLLRLKECGANDDAVDFLQHIVEQGGGVQAASEVMHEYIKKAVGILSSYEPSPYRDALVNLCAYIAERDK